MEAGWAPSREPVPSALWAPPAAGLGSAPLSPCEWGWSCPGTGAVMSCWPCHQGLSPLLAACVPAVLPLVPVCLEVAQGRLCSSPVPPTLCLWGLCDWGAVAACPPKRASFGWGGRAPPPRSQVRGGCLAPSSPFLSSSPQASGYWASKLGGKRKLRPRKQHKTHLA